MRLLICSLLGLKKKKKVSIAGRGREKKEKVGKEKAKLRGRNEKKEQKKGGGKSIDSALASNKIGTYDMRIIRAKKREGKRKTKKLRGAEKVAKMRPGRDKAWGKTTKNRGHHVFSFLN